MDPEILTGAVQTATGALVVQPAGNTVAIDLETIRTIAEAVNMLAGAALKGAFVIGVTEVIKAWFTDESQSKLRDKVMPAVALVLGVIAYVLPAWMSSEPVTFDLFAYGVALGGAATGLYKIRKEEKKQPDSEVKVSVPVTVPDRVKTRA